MNSLFNFELIASGDMSQNVSSSPFLVESFDIGFSIQCVVAGGATGTIQVQASNDYHSSAITNWADVVGAAISVQSDSVYMLNLVHQYYRWARVVFAHSSGSGIMSVRINGVGRSIL